jgi:ankyrin repeat protein
MYLDRGVDVDYVGPNDETALSLASKEGQSETVTLLLSKGCKVDSKAGRMALLSACQNGFTDIVEVLLKHQDGLILSGASSLVQWSVCLDNNLFNRMFDDSRFPSIVKLI